jgi:putative oxidoreductase
MLENIFGPYAYLGPLILRVGLGLVFLAHGLPKINPNSPVKGVTGFAGFLKQLNIPAPMLFAWIVALLETVGAVLLILGPGTRILSLLFAIDMLVAILSVKIGMMKAPFSGQNGWDFEFALLIGSVALLFLGSGPVALAPNLGL